MIVQVARIGVACLVMMLATAPRLHAQEPLETARQLYASAEYDDALRLLDGIPVALYSREDRQAIELYRALCLLAVGRRADFDRAVEAMIAQDPLYRPADDISPRMRAAFSDARQRVLPAVVQQHYNEARSAFERKEFAAAASLFERVVDVLNDPDITSAAAQPPLSDLRTLAGGFHDLSVKAIPPPPPPAPVAPPPPVDLPPRIHTAEERNVAPPIAVRQELPRFPGAVRPGGIKGVIEIVIDEEGSVESSTIVASTGATYDKLLQAAATRWVYAPATVDGTPVKFRKRIQVNISGP